jgi:hypothetical protein
MSKGASGGLSNTIGCLILVIGLGAVVIQCGRSNWKNPKPSVSHAISSDKVSESSPAYAKLAAIQASSMNPPDELLGRFAVAFRTLEQHCPDPPDRLAEFMVAGQKQLSKHGRRMSLVQLTEATSESLSAGAPELKSCDEVVALLVTMLVAE